MTYYDLIPYLVKDVKKIKRQLCCVTEDIDEISADLVEIQEEIDNLPDFSNVAYVNVDNEFTENQTIGIAEIGNWPLAPTYAMFRHSAQADNDYAFMQGPTGDSNFNSKAGQPMAFRFSNAEFARMTGTGLYIGGPGANPGNLLHLNSTSGTGQLRFSNGANYWDIGREQDVTGGFVVAVNGTQKVLVDPTGASSFFTDVTVNKATPIVKIQGLTNGQNCTFGIYTPVATGDTLIGGIIGQTNSGEIRFGGFSAGGYFPTFYSNNVEIMRINTSGQVGIGTGTNTAARLHVVSTGTEQFRLGYDLANYLQIGVNAFGDVTFDAVGGGPSFAFNSAVDIDTDGSLINLNLTYSGGGDNILQLYPSADNNNYIGSLGTGAQLRFLNSTGDYRWYNSSVTEAMSLNDTGDLELLGTISTGGGVAEWALGNLVVAPVSLDTTQSVQVSINGNVYQLLIAA